MRLLRSVAEYIQPIFQHVCRFIGSWGILICFALAMWQLKEQVTLDYVYGFDTTNWAVFAAELLFAFFIISGTGGLMAGGITVIGDAYVNRGLEMAAFCVGILSVIVTALVIMVSGLVFGLVMGAIVGIAGFLFVQNLSSERLEKMPETNLPLSMSWGMYVFTASITLIATVLYAFVRIGQMEWQAEVVPVDTSDPARITQFIWLGSLAVAGFVFNLPYMVVGWVRMTKEWNLESVIAPVTFFIGILVTAFLLGGYGWSINTSMSIGMGIALTLFGSAYVARHME